MNSSGDDLTLDEINACLKVQPNKKQLLQKQDLNISNKVNITILSTAKKILDLKTSSVLKENKQNQITRNDLSPPSSFQSYGSQPSQSDEFETTQAKRKRFQDSVNATISQPTVTDNCNKLNLSNSSDEFLLQNMSIISNGDKKENFYGLPLKVKDLLKSQRGIGCLYDWQDELLKIMQDKDKNACENGQYDLNDHNLLYLSPTSGGKTLVAEILMLQCLLVQKKNCIFVMPFVSIVQEKVELLMPFGEHLNFYVEEYAGAKGTVPPIKRQSSRHKSTLYICTIEKAHILINSLIETDRLNKEIGMLVADELHMIGDGPRGAIYEIILAKIKYCSQKYYIESTNKKEPPIRIIATTATLENKKEIATFLNAHLYERNFRPVELKEYIKLDKQIFEINKEKLKNFVEDDQSFVELRREIQFSDYTNDMKKSDPDGLIALVKEVFDVSPDGTKESCLIFCPSKKNCENVAQLLSTHLPPEFKAYKRDLKLRLFNEIKEANSNNICPILRLSIQFGIAYHHSGLTTDERQIIEAGYREGTLFLLTCTSTLAAGVNLPAKRVLIRSPFVGMEFMMANQYKQMIGRAGRAGLSDFGESFLLFKNQEKARVYDLISLPMKRCESSMSGEDNKATRLLVLSLIGLNLTHFGFNVLEFFKQTLFYMQKKEKLIKEAPKQEQLEENQEKDFIQVPAEFEIISDALIYLLKNKFLTMSESEDQKSKIETSIETIDLKTLYKSYYKISNLGLAAVKGNIDLDSVHRLYSDLSIGLKTMVLSNCLHLLYLCTPYDLSRHFRDLDFNIYHCKYLELNEDEVKCARIIGVQEDFVQKKRFQTKITSKSLDENILKRFYLTLIIYELWKNNKSVWKASSEFSLDRGFVQTIIQQSATFSSGVLHFCENLDEFWPYRNLLQELMKRLQYNCSSAELIPLLELDNVKLARAQQLFNAGFKTLEIIASTKAEEICDKIKNLPLVTAKKIIKTASRILTEKAEALQSEAENILQQVVTE